MVSPNYGKNGADDRPNMNFTPLGGVIKILSMHFMFHIQTNMAGIRYLRSANAMIYGA